MTVKDIENQIYLQLLAEKLTGEVKVGEKELGEFHGQFKTRDNNQPYEKVEVQVEQDYKAFTRARMILQTIQGLRENAKIVFCW